MDINRLGALAPRAILLTGAALVAMALGSAPALAAEEEAQATASDNALSEVVVTSQKREQSLQDVPVAVTAITTTLLQTNRVTNVFDLNSLAPNVTVGRTAGGNNVPVFVVRGITSFGSVPGSEKEVSLYIDGVYLGATRGSAFDFPDIERVEVLRGPQGTLFGRNATAGAVSFITHMPSGHFDAHQEFTYGNHNEFRSKSLIDFPSWGPFSASLAFMHDERNGDIKNLGAGMVWTRPGIGDGLNPVQVSPAYLGSKNLNAVAIAIRFEPVANFKLTYKFNYSVNHGTPEGVAPIAVGASALGVLAVQATPVVLDPSARRPNAVNNWFAIPAIIRSEQHALTAEWRVNESVSVKNILAYLQGFNYSTYEYGGLGGLVQGGAPVELLALDNEAKYRQWSDEVQINYNSKLLTLTAGGIYYHFTTFNGPPPGFATTAAGSFPGGVLPRFDPPNGPRGLSFNTSVSKAVYAQGELHILPQLDLVGGARLTVDDKDGTLINRLPAPQPPGPFPFTYHNTHPSFTASVNYKPWSSTLIYVKYATGFVSGGQVYTIPFNPETAVTWEGGIKADFLDHRLRTNLAVYDSKYTDLQSAQGGSTVGLPFISTLVVDLGNSTSKGFELEVTALPMRGLTLGGSVGYTDYKLTSYTPLAVALLPASSRPAIGSPTLGLPKWTGIVSADYVSEPFAADAKLHVNMNATYKGGFQLTTSAVEVTLPGAKVLEQIPATWTLNARVEVQHLKLGGADATIGLWGKNLTDNDGVSFPAIISGLVAASSFVPARTFGIDLIFDLQ